MSDRILIADDEEVLRKNLGEFLERAGYEVDAAADGEEALELVLAGDYSVLLTDIRMPRMDGISLLKRVVKERPETSVLIATAYASIESAVEALRHGAFDYVLKPIVFEDLLQKVRNLIAYRTLKDEVARLRQSVQRRLGFEGIIGESPRMAEVFELIDRVAPSQSTVLIIGQSGTGKELVARAVHARSSLADREFLAINVAAIPPELAESYLFGHERGAFTGAAARREGVLRAARGGTVFLDEVAELSMPLQAKLLRAIEMHEIMPVGCDRPTRVDFRLISATNQDIEQMVAEGTFRQDLLFRLNVFRIDVPPLRERREDVAALAHHFLTTHACSVAKTHLGLSNECMRLLVAYAWPGNVRELSNVIERAVLLTDGDRVMPQHLPAEIRETPTGPWALRSALEEFERSHLARVLIETGGDKEAAARLLDVHLATLYRRLDKLGLR